MVGFTPKRHANESNGGRGRKGFVDLVVGDLQWISHVEERE
jgi:hypothetical protein